MRGGNGAMEGASNGHTYRIKDCQVWPGGDEGVGKETC
jgi:hypothetical protein